LNQNKTLPKRTDILDGKHGTKLQQIIEWELDIADNPSTINLCYDRSCNLECPSCRKEKIFYNGKNFPDRYKQVLKINDKLLQMIHSKPHDVCLNITGSGDPFGSPSFFELMKKINPKYNPKIKLILQTNGVLWDEQRWAKVKNIHSLQIDAIVSLDAGIKEHYDKVRVGGDWNRLINNLTFIKSLNLSRVRLDMVVQKNNYQSIPEFIDIAKQHNFDSYTSRIFNWGTFTQGKFDEHNIFDKKHPEHKQIIEIINRDYNYDKHDWGNLTDFIK
jgi:MoaA/NifB/PqqE/SkfB family radical SAM enzyme